MAGGHVAGGCSGGGRGAAVQLRWEEHLVGGVQDALRGRQSVGPGRRPKGRWGERGAARKGGEICVGGLRAKGGRCSFDSAVW
jgi:hypothetical protein